MLLQDEGAASGGFVMAGLFRVVRVLTVVSALIGAGVVLWRRKDTVKRTWDSLVGVDGIAGSANQLYKAAGPVKNLVGQFVRLKG
jgi:hypothetical protein